MFGARLGTVSIAPPRRPNSGYSRSASVIWSHVMARARQDRTSADPSFRRVSRSPGDSETRRHREYSAPAWRVVPRDRTEHPACGARCGCSPVDNRLVTDAAECVRARSHQALSGPYRRRSSRRSAGQRSAPLSQLPREVASRGKPANGARYCPAHCAQVPVIAKWPASMTNPVRSATSATRAPNMPGSGSATFPQTVQARYQQGRSGHSCHREGP